ncbi:MAG: DUF4238 domain-containing protein [Christensenellales bacterium]|jgi:hypothetical protein
MKNTQKIKKQHYVPQCYLQYFAKKNTQQVYVYDKRNRKSWCSAILDVAAEGYFYDLEFPNNLDDNVLGFLQSKNITVEQLKSDQTIEKHLAKHVEDRYASLLSSLHNQYIELNPWIAKNCFAITKKEKEELSYCIITQMIRTRAIRDSMVDSADRLYQVLVDMGVDKERAEKYLLSESQAKNIQGAMLIDKEKTWEMTMLLNQLTWVFCLNRTSQPLYTSDNPIARKAHVKVPFLSMVGLKSPGVELSMPLSPNILLVMIDGDYHNLSRSIDRNWHPMNHQNVLHYNARCLSQSHRFIFSCIDNFDLLFELEKSDPQILESGLQSVTYWGEKTYKTRKR